jgi:hypothetical protein
MNMPRLTAEASLYQSKMPYRTPLSAVSPVNLDRALAASTLPLTPAIGQTAAFSGEEYGLPIGADFTLSHGPSPPSVGIGAFRLPGCIFVCHCNYDCQRICKLVCSASPWETGWEGIVDR